MSYTTKAIEDAVRNVFRIDAKTNLKKNKEALRLQEIIDKVFGLKTKAKISTDNPFLDTEGNLLNPNLDYNKLLNSPNVSSKTKEQIASAIGSKTSSSSKKAKSSGNKKTSSSKTQTSSKSTTGSKSKSTSTSSSGSSVADAAKKYAGTPYVWGGESMAEGGMDCSGFVYNALKDSGKNVGRTTAEGYRQGGKAVSKNDLQPGDLVFYGSGSATHVGIYMGNGQIMHSSGGSKNTKSNPGKGVTTTSIDYRSDYLGAVRY